MFFSPYLKYQHTHRKVESVLNYIFQTSPYGFLSITGCVLLAVGNILAM